LQTFNNQGDEIEFSSIFPFRISHISPSSSSFIKQINKENNYNYGNSNFDSSFKILTEHLLKEPFHFEPNNYQSGYAIPSILNLKVVVIPYYEIIDGNITQNVTGKENLGEVTKQTTTIKAQKLKYIIDASTFANSKIILVCKVKTVDQARDFLSDYLKAIGFKESNDTWNFVYNESDTIMQQLLLSLYDYWPTNESQTTSIKIGGKTISANYSGRGKYDLRLEEVNEEIKNRIINGDHIENITLKPPIGITGIKLRKSVPKISINDQGVISCRANINYENFVIIKWFIEETINIIKQLNKVEQPKASYIKLEDFIIPEIAHVTDSKLPICDNSLKINNNEKILRGMND
jgi:thermostable 8-oxoguanine DNA glycosylase